MYHKIPIFSHTSLSPSSLSLLSHPFSLCLPVSAGYWRCLGLDYRDSVLQHVLRLLDEQGWSYKRVPVHATCHLLRDLEPA